jgi:hypothetical protein
VGDLKFVQGHCIKIGKTFMGRGEPYASILIVKGQILGAIWRKPSIESLCLREDWNSRFLGSEAVESGTSTKELRSRPLVNLKLPNKPRG